MRRQRPIPRRTPQRITPQRPAQRLASEREVWQRIQKRGKASFLTRCTLSIGGLLFLFAGLAERLFSHQHLAARQVLGAALMCAILGFLAGSLLWQRGQAIVCSPKPRR